MKDRQFTVVLALVVAAGLVMGLIAFRLTGGAPIGANSTAAIANDGAPHPSAADEFADQPADSAALSAAADKTQNGEPAVPTTEPPEMQGPGSGDPPGTAASAPPAAPSSGSNQ